MKELVYTVKDAMGFHARPAGMLVQKAKEFSSEITVIKGDKVVSAVRLLAIMALAVKCGEEIKIAISGEDEEKAASEIEKFLKENL